MLLISLIFVLYALTPVTGCVLSPYTLQHQHAGKELTSCSTDAQPFPSLSIQVLNRSIKINSYGLVCVTDSFSVVNTGIEAASFIDIFYPPELHQGMISFSAVDNSGVPLEVKDVIDSSFAFHYAKRVFFDHNVPPGWSYNFTVTQTFANLVTPNSSSLYATLYRYPVIPHPILNCSIIISFHEGAIPQYPYPSGAVLVNGSLRITDANIGAFNATPMTVKYYGTLIKFEWSLRYVQVDPWRGIEVIDLYMVRNEGPQTALKLECKVPPFVVQLLAYDGIDVIGAWVEGDHIAVFPRIPLEQNDHYIYYVKYRIPMPFYHIKIYDHYVFAFPATPSYDAIIPASLSVIALSGSLSPQALYPPSPPIFTGLLLGRASLFLYKFDDILPNHSFPVYVYYTSSPISLYSEPIFFVAAILLIFTLALFTFRARAPVKPVMVEVREEYALLGRLCDLYEEKHLLLLERDELEEKRALRKVKKFEYAKRLEDIEKQLSSIDRQIKEEKEKLLSLNKQYAADFEELEMSIAQAEQARATIEFIRKRFAAGRISKEVYEKLVEEQEKKKDKFVSRVEKKIQELRRRML
ncbi:MAG: hypothetical protein QXK94_05260 [Candidatus Jordarchaeales archaeon]